MNSCSECLCIKCLYWWSLRCPFGECFDDKRATLAPFDKVHKYLRKGWTGWEHDQAHWCRGGSFYPNKDIHSLMGCQYFTMLDEKKKEIKQCLQSNVVVFQDGFVMCGIIESQGCEACYNLYKEKREKKYTKN